MKNNSVFLLFCFFFTYFWFVALTTLNSVGAVFTFSFLGLLLYLGLVLLTKNIDHRNFTWLEVLNLITSAGIGAVTTYFLIHGTNLSSVVAASLVGVLGYCVTVFYKKQQLTLDLTPSIYAGAFAGMASPVLFSPPTILISGFLVGMIFVLAGGVFNGCGGKLGSIAFISCAITVVCLHLFKL